MTRTQARGAVGRTAVGVGVFMAVYASWHLFHWGGAAHTQLIGDLFFLPLNGAAVIAALWAARRCRAQRPLRIGWLLIALGLLGYMLGDVSQTVYEVALDQKPYPSIADAFYLSFYPLMVAGVLRFSSWHDVTPKQRLMLGLDIATVGLGGGALVWFLVLGPNAFAPDQSTLQTLISIAYPVGDLVLIVALASVLLRRAPRSSASSLYVLVAGLCVFVAADLVYGYVALHGTYSGGDAVDILWMVALMFPVIAGVAQRTPAAGAQVVAADAGRRVSWLPYASVLLAFGTLAWAERDAGFFPAGGLVIVAVLIAAAVAARQLAVQGELLDTHRRLSRANDELAALATRDSLTGLANHRALVSAVEKELERSQRYVRGCALLFIDIDHFKTLNDGYGHGVGDATLKEFGQVVNHELRSIDLLGRWGGEEFLVLMPETDRTAAIAAAERIRAEVAVHDFAAAEDLHLTCSLGVAVYPEDGHDRATLVSQADTAMYAAKRLGRNQAISASDATVSALQDGTGDESYDEQALVGAVDALAMLVDLRDNYTGQHATDVASLAQELARSSGCDETQVRFVEMAARLHDVGKVAIPDAILRKPDALSPEEWKIMQTHSAVGAEVVARIPSLQAIAPIIRAHHERWDGTGYPDRIAGAAIPLAARIIGAADAYVAMTTDRPYQNARDQASAVVEVRRCAGTQFDPAVVDALEQILTATPTPIAA